MAFKGCVQTFAKTAMKYGWLIIPPTVASHVSLDQIAIASELQHCWSRESWGLRRWRDRLETSATDSRRPPPPEMPACAGMTWGNYIRLLTHPTETAAKAEEKDRPLTTISCRSAFNGYCPIADIRTFSQSGVMRSRWKSLYSRVRRFVDHDQSTRARPATPFLGILPIAGMGIAQSHLSGHAALVGWIVAVGIGLLWTAFAWWRGYRLLRTSAVKGDRQYDYKTKFRLPAEYLDTESATKARRHKR
jgi:hypothetical protein